MGSRARKTLKSLYEGVDPSWGNSANVAPTLTMRAMPSAVLAMAAPVSVCLCGPMPVNILTALALGPAAKLQFVL